jgi:NAD(P)-dependent dehydrogenase (short-subunit alcohol dehydrogenase family)
VAVVTGGRGDIGGAIAKPRSTAAGARVAVPICVPPTAGVSGIEHYVVDVSDPLRFAVARRRAGRLGPATIVVPAAATATVTTSLAMTPDAVGLGAGGRSRWPFLLAQDAARRLVAAASPAAS